MDSNAQQETHSFELDSPVDQTLEAREGTSEVGRIQVEDSTTSEVKGGQIAKSSPIIHVDRLSTLPPELLLSIFDLRHDPEQPLREPLSRTLLPYYRRNFYRHVRLRSPSSLAKLLETIVTTPSLGPEVLHLDVVLFPATTSDFSRLKKLLRYLPSLKSLKYCEIDLFSDPYAVSPSLHLQRLESISHSCNELSWSYLDFISRFTNLKSVEASFRYLEDEAAGPSTQSNLTAERLSLTRKWQQGTYPSEAWTAKMARYVDRFSRITHLTLDDKIFPRYSNFLQHLDTATTSLTSLTLKSPHLEDSHGYSCDHLLPRFVNLERLTICDGTISASLPSYLRQLPRLSYLRLGPATHYDGPTPTELLSLIEGPTRLQNLEAVVLDSLGPGQLGRRVDENDQMLEAVDLASDGWDPTDRDFGGWDEGSIAELKEAGVKNGVEVTGSSFYAAKVWASYTLEKANRIILEAYQSRSFDKYTQAKGGSLNYRLPDLDTEKLDSQNLKLVKIDLPEEEWFQFTLE